MKKVAVVGGGFAGLAVAYHLLSTGSQVTLFDGKGVGGGASGVASGLLHPYPGECARLSWKGEEGLQMTRALLDVVGKEVYKGSGILRLALSDKQRRAFRQRAEEREDVDWWEAERCRAFLKGSHYLSGIFIRSGITVHASLYLKGLWRVCESLGGHLEKRNVSLDHLSGFDQVVLASGGGIRSFLPGMGLKLKFNKGQILVCQKPSYFQKEASVIGKGYVAHSSSNDECFVGSTYEHDFLSEEPCLGTANDLIFRQIGQFFPSYGSFKVKGCRSALRVANQKSYHPLIGKLDENLYVITGLGSRGLLYHSYLGKILVENMCNGKEIPEEVQV